MSTNRNGQNQVMSIRERERVRNMITAKRMEMGGHIKVQTHKGIREGVPQRQLDRYSQFMRDDIHSDSGRLQKEINSLERSLEGGSPQKLNRSRKLVLEKQAERDREYFRNTMVPKSLFFKGYKDPEFEKATKACQVEHTPAYQKRVVRYQDSMRQIDPDGERADSIEKLRPS